MIKKDQASMIKKDKLSQHMLVSFVTNFNTGVMFKVGRSSSVEHLKGHCFGRLAKTAVTKC